MGDLGIEIGTRLRGAFLAGKIHMDDPKAFGIAVLPLEVIEQRPDKVTVEIRSLLDRRMGGPEVIAKIGRAVWVLDRS